MNCINDTSLTTAPFILTDKTGAETLLIIVKGTWQIARDGSLTIAEEQVPINFEPLYSGDPGTSSMILDTDVVLEKPGTDCVLLGHAWAPKIGAPHVDVSFAVGSARRQARVFGERIWMKVLGMTSISKPAPFEKMPLVWERAFGGADTSWQDPTGHEFCLENPVGRGFMARKSKLNIDGMRLPNMENPADLIKKPDQRPKPVGFGMIAPYWQPRAGYAGTYDDNWRKQMSPLPPDDLDPRFYAAAAPGLATPHHLTGSEQVLVENASQHGRLQFQLPGVTPRVTVRVGGREEEPAMALDTVVVEPDEERLVLVWRGHCQVHGRVHEIGSVRVEISPC